LLADIGGTNARFALETGPGVLEDIIVLPCASHPTLEAAMRSYLAEVGSHAVAHAAIGIANPVTGDWVQMTNHHWAFSIEATRQALELTSLIVINDFTALALSLPQLPRKELVQVGAAKRSRQPAGLDRPWHRPGRVCADALSRWLYAAGG
jgi:glucokinase